MRLVLLTNFVPPYRLPVFRALNDAADALRILVSTPMEGNRSWTPDWSGVDVVLQKTWTTRRTWRHERFTEQYELHVPYDTIAQLHAFAPDAIITAEFGARTAQAVLYGMVKRVPVIVWATLTDRLEPSRGKLRTVARRLLVRGVARVIVNGEAGARYIRSLGMANGSIVKIPQAIDTGPFAALPLEREKPYRLLYVGHVSELKSTAMLIDALSGLGREVELIVVGEGPARAPLMRRALPANVSVEWVGAVPYDELPKYYARAGIFVFPTQGDEWGLVVNEAMASGLPVLGSEYSQAVEEMVEDGENGWVFRPDNVEAIAQAIARALATDEETLLRMRTNARATASKTTPRMVAARLAEVARADGEARQ